MKTKIVRENWLILSRLVLFVEDPGEEDGEENDGELKRKLRSLSHCHQLGQLAELASDWLSTLV